jgi:P27 family predicted phage terminase small subunit
MEVIKVGGKNKKPIAVLVAEGKKHLTKKEIEERKAEEELVKPNNDKIKCPSWVEDEVAKKEFKRIAKELKELDLLTNLDINSLASYCIAYSGYMTATLQLQGQPLVIDQKNKLGYVNKIPNPLINIQLKYSDEMKKHASEMGLTINSRLKISVPKKEKVKDEVEKEFGDI